MALRCTFDKIDGGYLAVIKNGDGELLEEAEFRKLNDAVDWTNAFGEGYTHAIAAMERLMERRCKQ